jgi:uncharacterized protein (TIGR03086 family)
MDLVTLHGATVRSWLALVEGVGPDQWDLPTPCSDWSVRELVNHVVGEDLWSPPLLAGRTIEDVGDAFDGDVLGAEPLTTAREAAEAATAATAASVPAGGIVHLSYGDDSVDNYVYQLAADHLVHGWDLAAATGQDRSMPGEEVAAVAEWFAGWEEGYRAAGVIGARGPGGDDSQSDLLASFGRDPNWAG